ncbi:uncharacterized protein [Periplaneta americana]|uniref:uncharacterized protein n=1 Tax=Periplaneta americana TaxID=6978 RepID=UPI0037E8256C
MLSTRTAALASLLVVAHLVILNEAVPYKELVRTGHASLSSELEARKPDDSTRLNPSLQSLGSPGASYTEQPVKSEEEPIEEDGFRSHPDATLAITGLPFQRQQQQRRLEQGDEFSRQDPSVSARSEDELQADNGTGVSTLARTRREASNSSDITPAASEEDDYEDDSDMYLEPEEKPASSGSESNEETQERPVQNQDDVVSMGQHFFPSFAPIFPPPLGHSRPSIFQEPAHSQRPALLRPQHNSFQPINFGGGTFRDNSYLHATAAAESSTSNLLGSGNFGVIRGGTFYNDDDNRDGDYGGRGSNQFYSPYYHNGHGRPAFYSGGPTNPRPQHHRGSDFFANFRDFADINTPTKSSFSEYVVVYVNKNASRHDDGGEAPVITKPKNIIEQLTMLDNDDRETPEDTTVIPPTEQETKAEKKPSSNKLKLALYQDKFSKQKLKKVKTSSPPSVSKDLYEPLLALS